MSCGHERTLVKFEKSKVTSTVYNFNNGEFTPQTRETTILKPSVECQTCGETRPLSIREKDNLTENLWKYRK
jgi:hypothetical protein